jgi:toxin ParE1/3/4
VIVVVAAEAERDLIDGAIFYGQEANPDLGFAFITEFERSLSVLATHPGLGAPWRVLTRRLPLRRFPYSVIYHIKGEELHVIALAHQRRRPGYWSGRKYPWLKPLWRPKAQPGGQPDAPVHGFYLATSARRAAYLLR